MKKTQFKIGLLTACLLSVSSVANAQSCGAEACYSNACKCSRKNCDDKGLLEVINDAASSIEARLANLIPDRAQPCSQQKCGCAQCSANVDFAPQFTGFSTAPLTGPLLAAPVAQPDVLRLPTSRTKTPPKLIHDPIPVPPRSSPELVPLPDKQVDPFRDESTRILRPVPSRPAGYLRSNGGSQIEFDPQASQQQSMRSILMSKAASKSISDSANGLATTTSTRRAQPLGKIASMPIDQLTIAQAGSEVVPASLSIPISSMRSPTATLPAVEQFINPLRAQ